MHKPKRFILSRLNRFHRLQHAVFWLLWFPVLSHANTHLAWQGTLQIDANNISGLVITDAFIVLATDEGNALQILPRNKEGGYQAQKQGLIRLTESKNELDLEGLAWDEPYLYAIGSHAKKRKKIKNTTDDVKTLNRLREIIDEPSRKALFQLKLSTTGQVQQIKQLSLQSWIESEPLLAPFLALPSKENGIDIEGIAVQNQQLFIGFRGPILREHFVPILQFKLNAQQFTLNQPQLKLVNLGGLGIRDLLATQNQLWILAGPMNQFPEKYQVFRWSGQHAWQPLSAQLTLPTTNLEGKPEALSVDQQGQFWLAQDGPKDGAIQLLKELP
ncbi:MAG: DUF3616 domain-containing protein [Thiotrichales bacterium]|nr:DUF3616 domain-containing protein [Thiotrichales bacterium]